MNILAIDTATQVLSLALSAGEDIWLFEADAGLRHSELLMDCISDLLRRAGLAPADLSGVCCAGGPGSFTGLRIGFAAAKGLALSLGIPFAAVPTLDAIALPFSALPGLALPAIDAKRNAFFCALYRSGERLCPDMDASPQRIAACIAHEAKKTGASELPVLAAGPDAGLLCAALAETALPQGVSLFAEGGARHGYARGLLEIAKRDTIFEKPSLWLSGPEYIRKSDAELGL